jgi:hypothetical protein
MGLGNRDDRGGIDSTSPRPSGATLNPAGTSQWRHAVAAPVVVAGSTINCGRHDSPPPDLVESPSTL